LRRRRVCRGDLEKGPAWFGLNCSAEFKVIQSVSKRFKPKNKKNSNAKLYKVATSGPGKTGLAAP
jgi:hypothetical protein